MQEALLFPFNRNLEYLEDGIPRKRQIRYGLGCGGGRGGPGSTYVGSAAMGKNFGHFGRFRKFLSVFDVSNFFGRFRDFLAIFPTF